MNGSRRVVVTGTGVVSPVGNDVESFWASIKAGRSATAPLQGIQGYDEAGELQVKIGCQVKDFDPAKRLSDRMMQASDPYVQFAGAAADEAFAQSKLKLEDGYRAACIVGTGAGGLGTIEQAYRDIFVGKKRAMNPFTLLKFIGSSAAAHIGMQHGIKGPTFGTVSACATASHAIGLLLGFIRNGVVDAGIAGASEASLNYGSLRAWHAMRVLSPDGCRPFSGDRNGTVLGEGAGMLVLEELEHAKARGANILAEVKGFGMASDAKNMTAPDIEGPKEAMRLALADAGLSPSEIDYLNAHGTATALNDLNETRAIRSLFENAAGKLAVSSTKSMTGHLLGASGGIEAVACIKAIGDGFIPATVGLRENDPQCDLDYVPNVGRNKRVSYAMSNSFAFGGLNACLVFGPAPV